MLKTLKLLAVASVLGATAMGVSTPASALDMKSWQQAVVKKIQKSHIYPRSAIRKEIEGRAMVELKFDRAGSITNFEILEPTGEAVLDKTIPKMVEKMDPLPEPPAEMADGKLSITIPISWRLQ